MRPRSWCGNKGLWRERQRSPYEYCHLILNPNRSGSRHFLLDREVDVNKKRILDVILLALLVLAVWVVKELVERSL